jgi:hypothetical protein
VAGLGLEIGIQFQEELVSDVLAHLGALQETRQRVRHAAIGLAVSRSLWRRRVPEAPMDRLWFLGPALSRLVTDAGTVAALATADDRTMQRGTFSAAARRVLRPGPARTTVAGAAPAPAAVIEAANRVAPHPPATLDGRPLDFVGLAQFEVARKRTIEAGRIDPNRLLVAAADLAGGTDVRMKPIGAKVVTAMKQAVQAGHAVPWGPALAVLAASDGPRVVPEPLPAH